MKLKNEVERKGEKFIIINYEWTEGVKNAIAEIHSRWLCDFSAEELLFVFQLARIDIY